ncbi:MAG: VCBS repeat-containing protein [Planctomycetota bacterium]
MPTPLLVRLFAASTACGLPAQLLAPPLEVPWSHPTDAPARLLLGDVDLDADLDVVVFGLDGAIHVLFGDGLGGLSAPVTTVVAPSLNTRAALLDTDADGYLDVVVSTYGPGLPATVHRLRGDGTGVFHPAGAVIGVGIEFHATNLDGDGHPDLLSVGGGQVAVAAGAPGGGFLPASFSPTPVGAPGPWIVGGYLSGDLDGDGAMDLVVAGGLGPTTVMYGDGLGGFRSGQVLPFSAFVPRALADFDGDGLLDLVAGDSVGGLGLFRNSAVGFGAPSPIQGQTAYYEPAAAADLDGDGNVDLVAGFAASLQVLLGDGAGGFAPPQGYSIPRSHRIAIGDLDSDGRADVVSVGEGFVRVLRNVAPVFPGNVVFGDGTPGCGGTIGARGTRLPRPGTADFRVQFTNVPPAREGLLLVGAPFVAGWEAPGLGLRLHLWVLLYTSPMQGTIDGTASHGCPIPNAPSLIGSTVHLQSVWVADPGRGDTCSLAALELVSSRGLSITIQP